MYRKKVYEYEPTYLKAMAAIKTITQSLFYEATEVVQLYCYIYPVPVINVTFRRLDSDYKYDKSFDELNKKYKGIADSFFALYAMMVNEQLVPMWNKALVSINRRGDIDFHYKFDHALSLFEVNQRVEFHHKEASEKHNTTLFQWE
ncbi:hypothetical protein [Agarilytica rhodophyticola]|uniref:hypothetical protein n=1 Tax=Agarilytica rhodophyticola TaxID=1737490 RepID=UPI000B3416F7|nr:hypothetical protein [Agarilytica rhodophyticola]